jgi:hypothetical protein
MSELNKLIASLSGRAGPVLDPDDPVFISIQLYREAIKEGVDAAATQLAKIVSDAADQIATASVLSENTAKRTAEAIISGAGQWGSDQIRQAGADVVTRLTAELKAGADEAKAARSEAKVWARFSMAAAAGSMVAAMAVIAWQVWGPA